MRNRSNGLNAETFQDYLTQASGEKLRDVDSSYYQLLNFDCLAIDDDKENNDLLSAGVSYHIKGKLKKPLLSMKLKRIQRKRKAMYSLENHI